jgi:hypothetical protein
MIPRLYIIPSGFGAWTPLANASDDLSAFNNAIAAGDQYLASGVTDGNVLGEFSSAVQAYQAGASAAVGTLGPEINIQTAGASTALVAQASSIYSTQISPIAVANATAQDATAASVAAHQMQGLYTAALALSSPTASPPTLPAPPPSPATPTPTAASTSSSAVPWLIGGAAIAGLSAVAWWRFKSKGR